MHAGCPARGLWVTAESLQKNAEDFAGTLAAKATEVFVPMSARGADRPSGQRLASTIARMPALTAAGRLDHASTT
jgi:hypothetical protein